jgi:hypothetical protein
MSATEDVDNAVTDVKTFMVHSYVTVTKDIAYKEELNVLSWTV